jgi:hypothetical protein
VIKKRKDKKIKNVDDGDEYKGKEETEGGKEA